MLLLLTLVVSILLCSPAFAERWICFSQLDNQITKRVEGDCLKLGICSAVNNQDIRAGCFQANNSEWIKSQETLVKIDPNVISGSKVVDLSVDEKAAITAAINKKTDDEASIRSSLMKKLNELGITNEEINILFSTHP